MKESRPTLSVGMPVYNGEQFIREALDSILSQSLADFEVVISDNASTDATEDICRDYASRDHRIRYLRNAENLGATANYNVVARRSTGKYFKWASSNDICRPSFFEKCVAVLEDRDDVILCYPRTRLFESDLHAATDYEDKLDLMQDDPCERFIALLRNIRLNNIMNGVMRAEPLKATPLIADIFCGDRNPMADLVLQGKFHELPEYLFYRRMDEQSATHRKSADEVLAHFDPKMKKPLRNQFVKGLMLYFQSVRKAAIPAGTKLRLYRFLLRRARRNRDVIGREMWESMTRRGRPMAQGNTT